MRRIEIFVRLHLHQPAHRALELECVPTLWVEFVRRRLGRHDEVDLMLVEHVDQRHEALRLVAVLLLQSRHAVEYQRVIAPGDADVVLRSQGRAAQFGEAEPGAAADGPSDRSEEHTSELQSLMRIPYAFFCLKKKKTNTTK